MADQISANVIYEWSPKESSRADMPWTSVTSPYLHWGQLSPRTVLHEALSRGRDAAKFRRKLAWLVHTHFERLRIHPMVSHFSNSEFTYFLSQ